MYKEEEEPEMELEFGGELFLKKEVECIVIDDDEEGNEKKKQKVLTPDEAIEMWMKEGEVLELKKNKKQQEEIVIEGNGEEEGDKEEGEPKGEIELEVERKEEEESNGRGETENQELSEEEEKAWSRYSHRLLRLLRHTIPGTQMQKTDGWVMVRDIDTKLGRKCN